MKDNDTKVEKPEKAPFRGITIQTNSQGEFFVKLHDISVLEAYGTLSLVREQIRKQLRVD
jgi:hypothetical protein